MIRTLFYANLKLPNGGNVQGVVTTSDNKTFTFTNSKPDSDLEFSVQKNEQVKWQSIGICDYKIPQQMVSQLGNLVDYHKTDPNVIELLADNLFTGFKPKDTTTDKIDFDFHLAPDLKLKVYYARHKDTDGTTQWQFKGSKLIY